jgi:hypothetical protein
MTLFLAGESFANVKISASETPSSPRLESVARRYPPVASMCPCPAKIYAIIQPRAREEFAVKIHPTTIVASQDGFDRMGIIYATEERTAMLVVVNADD